MNFPKLQMLSEAKKKKPSEDEIDFDIEMADSQEEESTVDKAAVLAFLKSCDVGCRADIKKKLDKMCAADVE